MVKPPSLYHIFKIDYIALITCGLSVGATVIGLGGTLWVFLLSDSSTSDSFVGFVLSFGAIVLPLVSISTIIFIWRMLLIYAVFREAVIVSGRLINRNFVKGREKLYYLYTYQGQKYRVANIVNATEQVKMLNIGDSITMLVHKHHPKRALSDLYSQTPIEIQFDKQPTIQVPNLGLRIEGQYTYPSFLFTLWKISLPSSQENITTFGFTVGLTSAMIYLLGANLTGPYTFAVILMAVQYIIMMSWWLSPYIAPWLTTRILFKQPQTYQPITGWANNKGITYTSHPWDTTTIPWGIFWKTAQFQNNLGLLTDSNEFVMFKPDFFQTETEWKQFNQLINDHVTEAL